MKLAIKQTMGCIEKQPYKVVSKVPLTSLQTSGNFISNTFVIT